MTHAGWFLLGAGLGVLFPSVVGWVLVKRQQRRMNRFVNQRAPLE